jgi:hypothetical protein
MYVYIYYYVITCDICFEGFKPSNGGLMFNTMQRSHLGSRYRIDCNYECMYACMHACKHACRMYVCMIVCMYVSVYVDVYVDVYVHVYVYIYVRDM